MTKLGRRGLTAGLTRDLGPGSNGPGASRLQRLSLQSELVLPLTLDLRTTRERSAHDGLAAGESEVGSTGARRPARPGGAKPRKGSRPADSNVGRVVDVVIVEVGEHEAIVRLADGREGAIDVRHLQSEVAAEPEPMTPGRTIRAALLARSSSGGRVSMSRTWALQIEGFERAKAAHEAKETLTLPVVKSVKGGVVLDLGLRAFLPSSQAELEPGETLADLVGREVEVNIVSVDEGRRTVVVSRRGPVRAERRRRSGEVLRAIKVGETRTGKVTRLADFGAFVDIGGVEGLVHRSELSWSRIRSVGEVVSVGEEVEVKVLEVRVGKRRVGLSIRQAGDDPFAGLEVGSRLEGQVTSLVDYGAFIRVADGIEGLCHLSELAEYPVRHPEEIVIPGDAVMVEIISVDPKRRRVSLSIARAVRF